MIDLVDPIVSVDPVDLADLLNAIVPADPLVLVDIVDAIVPVDPNYDPILSYLSLDLYNLM